MACNMYGFSELPVGRSCGIPGYSVSTGNSKTISFGLLPYTRSNIRLLESDGYSMSQNSSDFIDVIRKTDNNFHSLMLVSHNPGMEIFAREISKNKTDKHYESIDLKYPTGGLVIIRFNLNIWSKIKYETGDICEFIKPRDL